MALAHRQRYLELVALTAEITHQKQDLKTI